jgi:serine/threonine protein kinase
MTTDGPGSQGATFSGYMDTQMSYSTHMAGSMHSDGRGSAPAHLLPSHYTHTATSSAGPDSGGMLVIGSGVGTGSAPPSHPPAAVAAATQRRSLPGAPPPAPPQFLASQLSRGPSSLGPVPPLSILAPNPQTYSASNLNPAGRALISPTAAAGQPLLSPGSAALRADDAFGGSGRRLRQTSSAISHSSATSAVAGAGPMSLGGGMTDSGAVSAIGSSGGGGGGSNNPGLLRAPTTGRITAPEKEAKRAVGTPDYLAPELLLGTGHGPEVDWCVFIWLGGCGWCGVGG